MKLGRLAKKNTNGSYIQKIVVIFSFVVLNIVLILHSSKNQDLFKEARLKTFAFLHPFLQLAKVSFLPILTFQEKRDIDALSKEIEIVFFNTLKEREEILKTNLQLLRKLVMEVKLDSLHLVIAKPEYYSSTGVLTDVVIVTQNNYEEEVSINSPIISNAGLFGRVTESDKNRFNILPIFHSSSRIPVYTKKSKIYGVALGNGFEIELIYLSENVNQIIEDEEVLTSGENNLLISDIPVGVIKIDGKRIKIKPFAEKRPQLLGIITSK